MHRHDCSRYEHLFSTNYCNNIFDNSSVLGGEIEFPVIFKICIYPGINNTALKEVGYSEIWDYFTGKSDHNKSFYGWAGHTADGKIFSSVKVKYQGRLEGENFPKSILTILGETTTLGEPST